MTPSRARRKRNASANDSFRCAARSAPPSPRVHAAWGPAASVTATVLPHLLSSRAYLGRSKTLRSGYAGRMTDQDQVTASAVQQEPSLPRARGSLSCSVIDRLQTSAELPRNAAEGTDPYGDDLQLALDICYELHYRGFADVDPALEWDPDLLHTRRALEDIFLAAPRVNAARHTTVEEALAGLLVEPVRRHTLPAGRGRTVAVAGVCGAAVGLPSQGG